MQILKFGASPGTWKWPLKITLHTSLTVRQREERRGEGGDGETTGGGKGQGERRGDEKEGRVRKVREREDRAIQKHKEEREDSD